MGVAELVREECPDGRIVYCAYSNYFLPATNVESWPENLLLLIAQPRCGFHDDAAIILKGCFAGY